MTCSRHEHSLFLHAHGQLGGVRRWLLESHLQNCDTCRARWARCVVEKDALRRALAPMPELDSPARSLMDTVSSRIRVERREPGIALSSTLALGGARRSSASPPRRVLATAVAVAALAIAIAALAAYSPIGGWGGAAESFDNPDIASPVSASPCRSCHPGEAVRPPKGQAPPQPTPDLSRGFRSATPAVRVAAQRGAAAGPARELIAAPADCPRPVK